MPNDSCATCRYLTKRGTYCGRYPEHMKLPVSPEDYWCGEFKRKNEVVKGQLLRGHS